MTSLLTHTSAGTRPGRVGISVVVPTYCEADNLTELVDRVSRTLQVLEDAFEIIVVDDDSQDGTADVIQRLQEVGHPVQLITRRGERGLSSAVLRGFESARGERLVCMDADLSHPPESLPALLAPLQDGQTEFVVGSRYVAGASTDEQWTWFRRLNSRIATWLARPFTRLRDPMAGFFAVPRQVFQRGCHWDPVGYKIGLEVLVKSNCQVTREIPIHFSDRQRGSSKLNWKEQRNYIVHLCRLADFRFPTRWRLIKYCCVGLVGATADLATFALLLGSGFALPTSRAAAIWCGMSVNFVGNEAFTFRTRKSAGTWRRYVGFVIACALGASINFAVTLSLPGLISAAAGTPLLNAACGIVAGTFFNFTLSRHLVFGPTDLREAGRRMVSCFRQWTGHWSQC